MYRFTQGEQTDNNRITAETAARSTENYDENLPNVYDDMYVVTDL